MGNNNTVTIMKSQSCGMTELMVRRVDLESLGNIIHNSPEDEIVEIYKSPMFGLSLAYDMQESKIIYEFNIHLEDLKKKSESIMFIDRKGRH